MRLRSVNVLISRTSSLSSWSRFSAARLKRYWRARQTVSCHPPSQPFSFSHPTINPISFFQKWFNEHSFAASHPRSAVPLPLKNLQMPVWPSTSIFPMKPCILVPRSVGHCSRSVSLSGIYFSPSWLNIRVIGSLLFVWNGFGCNCVLWLFCLFGNLAKQKDA